MRTWVFKFASYKAPDDIFDFIKSGRKTIETRPASPKYTLVAPGDRMTFVSLASRKRLTRTVTFVHYYKTVRDLVYSEDPDQIFPGSGSAENLLSLFTELKRKWGPDYAHKLDTLGIFAFGLSSQ